MRQLLLLRHAEAASAPGLDDVDRSLTGRGEADAAAVGRWLCVAGVSPGLVLCSPARRARQTWAAAAGVMRGSDPGSGQDQSLPPAVSYEERIYDADDAALEHLIRETDDTVRALLLVGHNPAVHRLAYDLSGSDELRDSFPAAALALLTASRGWSELTPASTTLTSFVPPESRSRT